MDAAIEGLCRVRVGRVYSGCVVCCVSARIVGLILCASSTASLLSSCVPSLWALSLCASVSCVVSLRCVSVCFVGCVLVYTHAASLCSQQCAPVRVMRCMLHASVVCCVHGKLRSNDAALDTRATQNAPTVNSSLHVYYLSE